MRKFNIIIIPLEMFSQYLVKLYISDNRNNFIYWTKWFKNNGIKCSNI